MKGLSYRLVVAALCACLLTKATCAWAGPATISDVIITTSPQYLLLYCTVQGSFSEDMTRAILSGISTTFTFRVELYKKRSFLPDSKVTEIIRHHAIKYDMVKNEFTVDIESDENKTDTVKEFFTAKKLMTEINGLKVVKLSELEAGQTYYIRIKAELNKVRLPLYLHYVLFFVSLWDFETDWHEVYFTF